jgi:hypothetical protein
MHSPALADYHKHTVDSVPLLFLKRPLRKYARRKSAAIRHLDSHRDDDLCWDMGRKGRLVLEHRFGRPKALSARKQLLSSI